jgi:orotate phosphoribosyltransferase
MSDQGLKVAEFLLHIKAIELKPQNPFTWASGLKSPIYCDNRKTLSYPEIRDYLRTQFCEVIRNNFGEPEVIAGVATGGIALGALVAQEMNLPFVYVRSEAKKHGLTNMIEGVIKPGQKVVVIEDLVSTGKSSLQAVDALREAQVEIMGMAAIFTYSFDKALANFVSKSVKLETLTNYHQLLDKAQELNYISDSDKQALAEWRKDPEAWSALFTQ